MALVADKDGNLYSTRQAGGAGYNACGSECGAIFEIKPPTVRTPSGIQRSLPVPGTERYRRRRSPPAVQGGAWTETILYNFTRSDQSMGLRPPCLFDLPGNLYGESSGALHGNGSIFELSPPTTPRGDLDL